MHIYTGDTHTLTHTHTHSYTWSQMLLGVTCGFRCPRGSDPCPQGKGVTAAYTKSKNGLFWKPLNLSKLTLSSQAT
jgi:hypothetical protein